MDQDYYAILGVVASDDLATLRGAYLKRARECHPDRGGSHAQMILMNKAWEILSNSESRRLYDLSRTGHATVAEKEQFEKDVAEAESKAADYPLDWASFEQWLQSVAHDFTTNDLSKSRSLALFVGVGGLIGWISGVMLFSTLEHPKGARAILGSFAIITCGPFLFGMLVGKTLHFLIGSGLHLAGIGAAGSTMRLTIGEKWKLAACAGLGALGLLLIAERADFQGPFGLTRDHAVDALVEAFFGRITYGAVYGFITGAILCYLVASREGKHIGSELLIGDVSVPFVNLAAFCGGITFGIAGAVCEYLAFPKNSTEMDVLRIMIGSLMGAIAFGVILVTDKKTLKNSGATSSPYGSAPISVQCEQCGQNLRIPAVAEELTITCTKCRHRFSFAMTPAPTERWKLFSIDQTATAVLMAFGLTLATAAVNVWQTTSAHLLQRITGSAFFGAMAGVILTDILARNLVTLGFRKTESEIDPTQLREFRKEFAQSVWSIGAWIGGITGGIFIPFTLSWWLLVKYPLAILVGAVAGYVLFARIESEAIRQLTLREENETGTR